MPKIREKLAAEHERVAAMKKPLSDDEVLLRLKSIRDGSLTWLTQSVITATSSGVSSACQALETSMRKISDLEQAQRQAALISGGIGNSITWAPYEPDAESCN